MRAPGAPALALTREFDAPRRMVFDALTRADLVKGWMGGGPGSLPVCEIDLRVGGSFRFVAREPDGSAVGWSGEYREIVPPERLVHTERIDGEAAERLVTTVLTECDGRTRMTCTVGRPSEAALASAHPEE